MNDQKLNRFVRCSKTSITEQRQNYAARRASLAVDRLILAKTLSERMDAVGWAERWGKIARWPTPRCE